MQAITQVSCWNGIKPEDKTVTLWFLISLQGIVLLHDEQLSMDSLPLGIISVLVYCNWTILPIRASLPCFLNSAMQHYNKLPLTVLLQQLLEQLLNSNPSSQVENRFDAKRSSICEMKMKMLRTHWGYRDTHYAPQRFSYVTTNVFLLCWVSQIYFFSSELNFSHTAGMLSSC